MQAFNYYIIKQDFVDSELPEERSFPDDRSHNTRIHKSPCSPFPMSVQRNSSSNKSNRNFDKIYIIFYDTSCKNLFGILMR
jgi:hypothetical protein